nr:hypothetical protein [Tanacetum cinerariifolium]
MARLASFRVTRVRIRSGKPNFFQTDSGIKLILAPRSARALHLSSLKPHEMRNFPGSLEHEQERTVVTFGALWRPVLALEAWAGRVDTWMTDMSWAGYDDHRLVYDMLLQQTALQREPQEMRDRVTMLEQERERRDR